MTVLLHYRVVRLLQSPKLAFVSLAVLDQYDGSSFRLYF